MRVLYVDDDRINALLFEETDDKLLFRDVTRYFQSCIPAALKVEETIWFKLRMVGQTVEVGPETFEDPCLEA